MNGDEADRSEDHVKRPIEGRPEESEGERLKREQDEKLEERLAEEHGD